MPQRFTEVQGLGQLAAIWGAKPNPITSALGSNPIERSLGGAALKPDDQTANFIAHLADSWDQAIGHPEKNLSVGNGVTDIRALNAASPLDLGYFYSADETDHSRHRILVQVFPVRKFASLTSVTRTVYGIRDAARDAAKDFPEFQVGITGRPALEAEEMRTTDEDTHHAEIIALIVVYIGMAVMLRSIWLALAAELSLGVGIAWTFGWATATIGQLNLLSLVFLIALIGIGMDYLVQILSRYRLEARRYERRCRLGPRLQARRTADQHRLPRRGRGVLRRRFHRFPGRRPNWASSPAGDCCCAFSPDTLCFPRC